MLHVTFYNHCQITISQFELVNVCFYQSDYKFFRTNYGKKTQIFIKVQNIILIDSFLNFIWHKQICEYLYGLLRVSICIQRCNSNRTNTVCIRAVKDLYLIFDIKTKKFVFRVIKESFSTINLLYMLRQ